MSAPTGGQQMAMRSLRRNFRNDKEVEMFAYRKVIAISDQRIPAQIRSQLTPEDYNYIPLSLRFRVQRIGLWISITKMVATLQFDVRLVPRRD